MPELTDETLREELEHFLREREQVRQMIGSIGGAAVGKRDLAVNIAIGGLMLALLVMDFLTHVLGLYLPVHMPPLFSVEIGVFLVSLKIIWMIHRQTRVDHFQFWILHSIEFRLNDLARRLDQWESSPAGKGKG